MGGALGRTIQTRLYILSKTVDTHVTQLSCKHTHNDTVCNQENAGLVQQYTIEYTSFKIQSGNFKCDLPTVFKCLIQQYKVHKCEGRPIETTSLL